MRGRGVWPAVPGEPTKFAGPMKQHMAEGGGFEPPEGVNLLRFSRPPQSAALPSLRRPISWRHENGGASGNRTHVAAVQRRSSPAELWPHEKSRAASPMPTAPGHDGSPFVWLPHKPNHRGPSPGNDGRECRCRSGVKEKPGQSCLVAGHPDKKRHPTTFYSGDLYVVLDFL